VQRLAILLLGSWAEMPVWSEHSSVTRSGGFSSIVRFRRRAGHGPAAAEQARGLLPAHTAGEPVCAAPRFGHTLCLVQSGFGRLWNRDQKWVCV